MINISNLNKKIGKKEILKGIKLEFNNGVYGLLGPNGAGKTTLLRCISTLYPTKNGEITYLGKEIMFNKNYLQNVGYLPQNFGIMKEFTLFDALSYIATLKDIPKEDIRDEVNDVLEKVNLSEQSGKKIRKLSGGMVRRMGIAQAFLGNPKVVILDEPTAGLDPEERLRFKRLVLEEKNEKIVIISTHIVEDVESVCENIVILNDGEILSSAPSEQIKKYAYGKVYEALMENIPLNNVFIEKEFLRDGKTWSRFISNDKKLNFQHCDATVEDGYLCRLKNV